MNKKWKVRDSKQKEIEREWRRKEEEGGGRRRKEEGVREGGDSL